MTHGLAVLPQEVAALDARQAPLTAEMLLEELIIEPSARARETLERAIGLGLLLRTTVGLPEGGDVTVWYLRPNKPLPKSNDPEGSAEPLPLPLDADRVVLRAAVQLWRDRQ